MGKVHVNIVNDLGHLYTDSTTRYSSYPCRLQPFILSSTNEWICITFSLAKTNDAHPSLEECFIFVADYQIQTDYFSYKFRHSPGNVSIPC